MFHHLPPKFKRVLFLFWNKLIPTKHRLKLSHDFVSNKDIYQRAKTDSNDLKGQVRKEILHVHGWAIQVFDILNYDFTNPSSQMGWTHKLKRFRKLKGCGNSIIERGPIFDILIFFVFGVQSKS